MKKRSEEKLRIGKPNDKLPSIPKATKVENLSKTKVESNDTKTKICFNRTVAKSLPEKKSSFKNKLSDESIAKVLGKLNKVQKIGSCVLPNDDAVEAEKDKSKTSETKNDNTRRSPVFEKIKKNKSWDHVEKVSSKTTVAKRVSDVLQQVKQRTLSDVDLFQGKPKVPPEKKTQLSDIFRNFSSKSPKPQKISSEQTPTEKSMSFDSLKFLNRSKQLCKCYSLENDRNKVPENPIGVFNVHKKSFVPAAECSSPKVAESSSWFSSDKPWEKNVTLTQEVLNDKKFSKNMKAEGKTSESKIQGLPPKAYRSSASIELGRYQKCCSNQDEDNISKNGDLVYPLTDSKLSSQLSLAKNYCDPGQAAQHKETVQICQCLHFHTEEGFQRLTLHNNARKEYGHKFFRVNYYPRERDEEEGEEENRVELVDKETITENETEEKDAKNLKNSPQEPNQSAPVEKKISTRFKPVPKSSVKTLGKSQEKAKKKESKDGSASQLVPLRNEKPKCLLGQSETKEDQSKAAETKPKKVSEVKERKKLSPPLRKSELISNEEIKQKKALEELDALEKLLTKLNSVENSLKKRQTTVQQKAPRKCAEEKSEARSEKKKTNSVAASSRPFFADNEAEEEYQRRRRKLKSAIIRHVENWLKVDFSDF